MSVAWERWDAEKELARRRAREGCPPCPACGAPGEWDLLDVTTPTRPEFVPGHARCTAECWREDPERYLAATKPTPTPPRPSDDIPDTYRTHNESRWKRKRNP